MNSSHLRQMKRPEVEAAIKKDHGSDPYDYGSSAEQRSWLKKNARKRDKCLKQFCKLSEGERGNSRAFIEGYEQIDWKS